MPVSHWRPSLFAEPVFEAAGEHALLLRFGDTIDEAIHRRVLAYDAAIARGPPPGFIEAVPSYTALMILFDPLITDHASVERHVRALTPDDGPATEPNTHEIGITYGGASGPDLEAAAGALGLTPEDAISLHLAGDYRVYMYGFAPGFAYLGGVPERLALPRKQTPAAAVAAGSVIIAGRQCIVTTLNMPSGWWVIGHSDALLFDPSAAKPFAFEPGDRVRFRLQR